MIIELLPNAIVFLYPILFILTGVGFTIFLQIQGKNFKKVRNFQTFSPNLNNFHYFLNTGTIAFKDFFLFGASELSNADNAVKFLPNFGCFPSKRRFLLQFIANQTIANNYTNPDDLLPHHIKFLVQNPKKTNIWKILKSASIHLNCNSWCIDCDACCRALWHLGFDICIIGW